MQFSLLSVLATASLTLATDLTNTLPGTFQPRLTGRDLKNHNLPPALPVLRDVQPAAQTVDIPVDHFASSSKTFPNRYWVNSTYYKDGGPVFLLDVGEETVSDDFIQAYLMESQGASSLMQLTRQYKGIALMLEHRFYGDSLPCPVDQTTGEPESGYDCFQYHTVEQALEDVVFLANNFKPKGLDSKWSTLAPSNTPWIFIGGSYPGNRAAWIRIRNPDIIYASWSSSAPVQTTIDMASYYEQVYKDMTANCSADLAASGKHLDQVFSNGSASDRSLVNTLVNLVELPANVTQYTTLSDQDITNAFKADNSSDLAVAEVLGQFISLGFQSYGFEAATLPACNAVEAFNPQTLTTSSLGDFISSLFNNTLDRRPSSQSIAQEYGNEQAFYAIIFGIFYQNVAILESQNNTNIVQSEDNTVRDGLSWLYQTCTELGYFQVSNTSSQYNLLSSAINVTSWQAEQCNAPFGYFSTFPSSPDVSKLVKKYGGWNMNPSQVMFTNGLKDPWHTLSVQSDQSDIGAPMRSTTSSVPACGAAPNDNQVFGMTYPNGYHCSDLLGSTGYPAQGQALFQQALDTWLPCFKQHTVNVNATATPTTSVAGGSAGTSPSASASKTGGAGALLVSRGAQLGMAAVIVTLMLV